LLRRFSTKRGDFTLPRSYRHLLWLIVIILWCARPGSYWEFDEPLFSEALRHYDPIAHHPPPPGYPVFIFVAKIFRVFFPSDLSALVGLSVVASAIGFVMLAHAFARLTDPSTGIAGAVLFYLSPALLVHSTMPISEPGALALLATALYFARSSPELFGVFAALTVGWRPQFSIFVVPLVLAVHPRSVRKLAAFTAVCFVWLIPLTAAVGGVQKLIAFETGQAQYLAAHDAAASRMSWSLPSMVIHFVSHPWGPRVMTVPLFLAAAYGAWRLRRDRMAVALAIAAAVYIAVALKIMDPADGVRYAIPFSLVVAFFAGVGAMRVSAWAPVVFAAGSIIYVSSFVVQRHSIPSPAVRAASLIPANAAVGYELSLWPHATYFFGRDRVHRIDNSVQELFDRPDVPLYAYLNGTTDLPHARTFRWENSDAYWNLTRNLYRVVSVAPLGPERRYRVVRGVYTQEREADAIVRATRAETSADVWRWLDGDAVLEMPRASGVELVIGLPKSFPHSGNRVTISADDRVITTVELKRGERTRVALDFPAPSGRLRLQAERTITPPGDPRRLAFVLYDVVFRLPAAAAARRRAA
jgi:hypothetical protein